MKSTPHRQLSLFKCLWFLSRNKEGSLGRGRGKGERDIYIYCVAMGKATCCDNSKVKRGSWSPEEDKALRAYVEKNGIGGNWISLPQKAGTHIFLDHISLDIFEF